MRALLLAAPLCVIIEVVADLGRDHDLLSHPAEGVGQERLSEPRAVGVGRVKVVDALLEGAPQQAHRALVIPPPPPAGRDRPHAEADLGYFYVRAGQVPVLHLDPSSISRSRNSQQSVTTFYRHPL